MYLGHHLLFSQGAGWRADLEAEYPVLKLMPFGDAMRYIRQPASDEWHLNKGRCYETQSSTDFQYWQTELNYRTTHLVSTRKLLDL